MYLLVLKRNQFVTLCIYAIPMTLSDKMNRDSN